MQVVEDDIVEDDTVDEAGDELDTIQEVDTENGKKLSKTEKSYFAVVIRGLVNVLKDKSLAIHHQAASNVAIRIIRILGPQAFPQIGGLMDGIISRLNQSDANNNLRDALLDHLISIIHIIGRIMNSYADQLIKVSQLMRYHTN